MDMWVTKERGNRKLLLVLVIWRNIKYWMSVRYWRIIERLERFRNDMYHTTRLIRTIARRVDIVSLGIYEEYHQYNFDIAQCGADPAWVYVKFADGNRIAIMDLLPEVFGWCNKYPHKLYGTILDMFANTPVLRKARALSRMYVKQWSKTPTSI